MSGSLLFLETDDFFIKANDGEKDMLCHRTSGYSLILFYSSECKYCPMFKSIFLNLPKSVVGCNFGIVNVDSNKKLIMASQSTTSPIKFVPFIIFYYNGRPIMSYNQDPNEEQIKKFIVDVSNHIQKKQQFSKETFTKKQQSNVVSPQSSIPAYCIGQPICGNNNVCYLTMISAYDAKKN